VPTLTADAIGGDAVNNGYTLNLTANGQCTSTNVTQCVAISNSSLGTVINPVQASRIVTRNKVSVKYGKVEVVAKMPEG
jgi:beta-glucanase (GH16 family)